MEEFNQDAVDVIVRWRPSGMARRGARLVLVFPAVAAGFWAVNRDLAEDVATRLPRRSTLTRPQDSVFDDRLFFDRPTT